jgi:hypothetical protein
MKIPKGADIRVDTNGEAVELHITAAITTKAQAHELIGAIRQFAGVLASEKRVRKSKVAAAA